MMEEEIYLEIAKALRRLTEKVDDLCSKYPELCRSVSEIKQRLEASSISKMDWNHFMECEDCQKKALDILIKLGKAQKKEEEKKGWLW